MNKREMIKNLHDEEMVDRAGQESFPASDPPCWTPTFAGQRPGPEIQQKIYKLEHPHVGPSLNAPTERE